MHKLLQRPPIKHGEWWEGYVARILVENGCPSKGKYLLGKLEPLVTVMVSENIKRGTQAGEALTKGIRSFQQYRLPKWAVKGHGAPAAHCPDCMREDPFIRLSWRLPAVTHCETHNRPLQISCGACERLAFHWDLARQSCRCGAPFAGLPSGPSLNEMAPAARQGVPATDSQRDSWIFSAQQADRILALADGSSKSGPSPIALMTFVGHLISCLTAGRQRNKQATKRTIGGLLMQLGVSATPSVTWIEELWLALPSAAYLRSALNLVLCMHHSEQLSPSEMGSLPLRDWAETLCGLGASPASAERRGWVSAGSLSPGLVSATSAAKLAGVQVNYFLALRAKGLARPVRTLEVGLRQYQFSAEQVQQLKPLHRRDGRSRSSRCSGIEGNGRKILGRAGVIDLVTGPDGRTWLHPLRLQELLAELDRHAVSVERIDASKVSLGSKRIWQSLYIPALKPLFTKLRNGEIKLWTWSDQAGLARFYVGPDALEFLHRGSVGRAGASSVHGRQPELPLFGGEMAWVPSPQSWGRPVRMGWVQRPSPQAFQLPLQLA